MVDKEFEISEVLFDKGGNCTWVNITLDKSDYYNHKSYSLRFDGIVKPTLEEIKAKAIVAINSDNTFQQSISSLGISDLKGTTCTVKID